MLVAWLEMRPHDQYWHVVRSAARLSTVGLVHLQQRAKFHSGAASVPWPNKHCVEARTRPCCSLRGGRFHSNVFLGPTNFNCCCRSPERLSPKYGGSGGSLEEHPIRRKLIQNATLSVSQNARSRPSCASPPSLPPLASPPSPVAGSGPRGFFLFSRWCEAGAAPPPGA